MKQPVGIVLDLALQPDVFFMDDPFSSLDALTAVNIPREVLYIYRDPDYPTGSVIMVTHNVQEAVEMADRVVVLSARPAKIVDDVKIDLERPRSPRDPVLYDLADRIISRIS